RCARRRRAAPPGTRFYVRGREWVACESAPRDLGVAAIALRIVAPCAKPASRAGRVGLSNAAQHYIWRLRVKKIDVLEIPPVISDKGKLRMRPFRPPFPPPVHGTPTDISDGAKVKMGAFSPAFPRFSGSR